MTITKKSKNKFVIKRNLKKSREGESEIKNLFQMAENAVGVAYHRLHHFLTEAPWSSSKVIISTAGVKRKHRQKCPNCLPSWE